jgi:polyphenol oxidase
LKRLLLAALGVLCLLIGVAGLILPILPGWLFIFIGLSMVAPRVALRLKWWLFRRKHKGDLVFFDPWLSRNVEAGYTTRHFSLHLTKTDDLVDAQKQNEFVKLFAASEAVMGKVLRPVERLVLLKQVHGGDVVVLDDPAMFEKPGFYPQASADAAITNVSCLTLLVFSADCLSVFFSAGAWVGLAHAGWRGTKEGISAKVLKLISERAGVPPSEVRIIFGPRIGPSAYEVGSEFCQYFPATSFKRGKKGGKERVCFDLSAENKRQLLEAGAKPRNVTDHGVCTVGSNRDLYSFRKEGEKAGRIVSFITKV